MIILYIRSDIQMSYSMKINDPNTLMTRWTQVHVEVWSIPSPGRRFQHPSHFHHVRVSPSDSIPTDRFKELDSVWPTPEEVSPEISFPTILSKMLLFQRLET